MLIHPNQPMFDEQRRQDMLRAAAAESGAPAALNAATASAALLTTRVRRAAMRWRQSAAEARPTDACPTTQQQSSARQPVML